MMKLLRLIILIIPIWIIIGCTNESENISSSLFNIDGINTININELERQGYSRLPETDVLIYTKEEKDTIISLGIDEDLNRINGKAWEIKLESKDVLIVKKIITDNKAFLRTQIYDCVTEPEYTQYFFVVEDINNNIFLCYVVKKKDDFHLQVVYSNPLSH